MQTIGERLLEARQRRGVSIREAAESTKVRGDYLMAMEANQFESIPLADVYKRGFLKIYARFLRLDSDRITGEYNGLLAARLPHGAKVRRVTELNESSGRQSEVREPEAPDEFASGAIEFAQRPDNGKRSLAIGVAVALALLVVVALAVRGCGGESKPAASSSAVSSVSTVAQGKLTLACRNKAPTPVRLVRLADNTPVFEKTLKPGETVTIEGLGKYEIYASPLEGIHFSVNGGGAMAFPAGYAKGPVDIPAKAN